MKEFSGGFFNMPVECQKKEAELMNFSIEGALRSMEPENPQRISADHEPGHKGHGKGTPPTLKPSENLTPEEVAQRRELAATGIFDNEGDDAPDDPSLDPPEDTWDFLRWELSVILPLLRDKVKFVGFTKDQEQILASNLLRTVASKKCVDAFRKAGLSTPAEVMRDRGLIFGTFESLLDPSNNQVYGITEDERRYIRATKNDVLKMAFTADPDEKPGPVITWFHDWAFTGTADTTYSFEETFTHERIHASGVPPTPYYFLGIFKIGHDLDGYEHYGNIIENCSNEGGTE